MRGLLLKDFINLKKNAKIFGVLTVLYAFMAFTAKNASFFSSIFTMLIAVLTLSVYSYDEIAKWDPYALTMPINKEDIVRGKYIMMVLLTLIGTIVSATFTIVLNVVLKTNPWLSGMGSCAFGASVIIFFYCIIIPFITKLGVEKSRFVFFAVYIVSFAVIYFIGNAVENGKLVIPDNIMKIGEILIKNRFFILPVVLLIAFGISYSISVYLYRGKEF